MMPAIRTRVAGTASKPNTEAASHHPLELRTVQAYRPPRAIRETSVCRVAVGTQKASAGLAE